MKYQFLPQMEAYDGSQLRSLFTYMKTELPGNSLTAWMGPCDIPSDKIVDGEDLLANSEIRGSKMLHFICEKFNSSLAEMVGLQRIFAALSIEVLEEFIGKRQDFVRKGDDVFYKEGKLSISIATVSPTSALFHFAFNVSNEGTPVKTSSLEELNVEAKIFADTLGKKFTEEVQDIEFSTQKVKWVL